MGQETLTFKYLQQALDTFIIDLANTYKRSLIRDGKQASGNLVNSIKPLTIEYANSKMSASISVADYWKYVEKGRKPGKFPPVDAILSWIRIKPVLPRPMNGLKAPSENQLAFLIGRKIARDGIKAGNQFEESLDLVWRRHQLDISNAITMDLNQAVELIGIPEVGFNIK